MIRWCLISVLGLLVAGPALADPCKAIPDKGPMPAALAAGRTFSGPVVYIGDGDSLCVETSPGPNGWVEVRLEDFYAPELHAPGGQAAKQRLEGLVMGRRLVCKADHRSHDRVVAGCRLNGAKLGDLLRRAGGEEGGRGR